MSGHIGDMVSQHWNTPEWIIQAVNKISGPIDLDPCDNEWSVTKARVSYKLPSHNGLTDSWIVAPDGSDVKNVFCNPPYGTCWLYENRKPLTREEYKALPKEEKAKVVITSLEDWCKKADSVAADGQEVYLLIPSSTETGFWFDYLWDSADAICFIKGRVKHPLQGQDKASSTKGSALIYWGPKVIDFYSEFEDNLGHKVVLPYEGYMKLYGGT